MEAMILGVIASLVLIVLFVALTSDPRLSNGVPANRRLRAEVSKRRHSSYGGCGRCEIRWPDTQAHYTDYSERSGCFPLCEECWSELTPDERLPYYMAMMDRWHRDCRDKSECQDIEQKRESIRIAVLAGK